MRNWEKDGLEFRVSYNNVKEEAQKVAKELVRNLMYEMAKHCTLFNNDRYQFHDLPYSYRERQLDGVLLPALHKLCHGLVMTEIPLDRKERDEDFQLYKSKGRGDYWCIYKEYSVVIELKHSYDNMNTTTTNKERVIGRWQEMNEQLKDAESYYRTFGEKTKGVIRLGLHVISSYTTKDKVEEEILKFRESADTIYKRLMDDLWDTKPTTKPDMAICWMIPDRLIIGYEDIIPGLWLFAKFYDPIKHKGSKKYKKKD